MTRLIRDACLRWRSCPRCPPRRRSRCWRPPPTGARSRPSWAATRSTSTRRPTAFRTFTASMPSRASSRARALPTCSSPMAPSSRSGWLPVLLQESGNARIQPGAPGYFEASSALRLLDDPDDGGSLDGRHPRPRQPARAARPAQRALRSRRRSPSASRRSMRRTRRTTGLVARTSRRAGSRPWRAGRNRPHRSRACRSS